MLFRSQDGCTPEDANPALVLRVTDQYLVAFFLTYVAGQDESAALSTDSVQDFGDISLAQLLVG